MNRDSQTRMTNDQIRRNTEILMTNGTLHTRALFDIRASDFFRHLSFDNRFMVPTHGIKAEGALHEPSVYRIAEGFQKRR